MTGKTKRFILLTVLVLAGTGGGVGYYLWNKKHFSVSDSSPAATVTAIVLHQTFASDSTTAKNKFTGDENNKKVIAVQGEIAEVKKDQKGQDVLLLKTASDGAFINCTMEGPLPAIQADSSINLKGMCTGYNFDADMGIPGDVILVRCYVMK